MSDHRDQPDDASLADLHAVDVLPYAPLPPPLRLTHPAAAVSGWATFAIVVLLIGGLSGYANRIGVALVCAIAVASLTALVSGFVTTRVLPPGTPNRGVGVVGMVVGAPFAVLSLFYIYCLLTGVWQYV